MAISERKRILLVHSLYQTRGGEEQAIETQKRALQGHSIDIKVLYRNFDGPVIERQVSLKKKIQALKDLFFADEAARELGKEIDGFDPDIVHFHNLVPHWGYGSLQIALDWALRKGKKVVSTIHNQRWVCANGLFYRKDAPCFDCFEKRNPLIGGIKNCRGNIPESLSYATAISSAWMRSLYNHPSHFLLALNNLTEERLKFSFPAAQVRLLPNPVAPILQTKSVVNSFGTQWQGKRYGVIGRLSPEKGVTQLLKELKWGRSSATGYDESLYEPSIQFVFAGDGPLKAQVEAEAKLNPRVVFLGLLKEDEVCALLKALDGYFFSSLVEEQSPTVLRLAQKLNLPIYSWFGRMKKESLNRWGTLLSEEDWAEKYMEIICN